jgi:hypothetical protein
MKNREELIFLANRICGSGHRAEKLADEIESFAENADGTEIYVLFTEMGKLFK